MVRLWLLAHWQWAGLYVLLLSLAAFCLMGHDKHQARRNGWRVRERTFFIVALLGGALGGVLGMFFFHHKTRHWYFRYGLPAILILQVGLVVWLLLSGVAS